MPVYYQIIYSSHAVQPMSADGHKAILEDARSGNESRGITGALVYVDGVFLQIIEGEKDTVLDLMSSIDADDRHRFVKILFESEVEERAFPHWKMAYLNAGPDELSSWAGLPGTESTEDLLQQLHREPGRIPDILVNIVDILAE